MGICNASKDNPRNCRVTPDSGTTMMTMPSWAYQMFLKQLNYPLDSGYVCNPGFEFEQGELTVVINGVEYPIPSHHWIERSFPGIT